MADNFKPFVISGTINSILVTICLYYVCLIHGVNLERDIYSTTEEIHNQKPNRLYVQQHAILIFFNFFILSFLMQHLQLIMAHSLNWRLVDINFLIGLLLGLQQVFASMAVNCLNYQHHPHQGQYDTPLTMANKKEAVKVIGLYNVSAVMFIFDNPTRYFRRPRCNTMIALVKP